MIAASKSMVAPKSNAEVELRTPTEVVFKGRAQSIDFEAGQARITIRPDRKTYMNMVAVAQLIVRDGPRCLFFELRNAFMSWNEDRLTVMAESAVPMEVPGKAGKTAKTRVRGELSEVKPTVSGRLGRKPV